MQDPILLWNHIALEANRVSHTNGLDEQTGPTRSSRALAIVHLAMYDAYAGVINNPATLPRYIAIPPSIGPPASADSAVAAAAHKTLSELFPGQKPFFDLLLGAVGNPADPGHAFGIAVGQAILDDRANDPLATSPGYVAPLVRGGHRVDPDDPGQGFHGAFYGSKSKGFAITQRIELAQPPFDDTEYDTALREVRGLGIKPELMGTLPSGITPRNVNESLIGLYWAYDGVAELGTPPRLYNQIVREIAIKKNNSVTDNARLFAFINVAMADAGILAWDEKYKHNLWRPVVGIREHDKSMGPASTIPENTVSSDCDSAWLPLGGPRTNRIGKNVTPPFPAYPSGHATFGAAAFHITRLFYKEGGKFSDNSLKSDTLFNGLSFVSDELNGVSKDNTGAVRPRHVRNFPGGLWQMIIENGRSRVYLGVHWVFDAFVVKGEDANVRRKHPTSGLFFGGVPLGLQIAEDIFNVNGGLAPVKSTVPPRL